MRWRRCSRHSSPGDGARRQWCTACACGPLVLSLRGACAVRFSPCTRVPCPWILSPFRNLLHAESSLVLSRRNVPGPGVSRFVDLLAYRRASRRPAFVSKGGWISLCGSSSYSFFHNSTTFLVFLLFFFLFTCPPPLVVMCSMDCLSSVFRVRGVPLAATYLLQFTPLLHLPSSVLSFVGCYCAVTRLATSLRGVLITRSIARWRRDSRCHVHRSIWPAILPHFAPICSLAHPTNINVRPTLLPICPSLAPKQYAHARTHTPPAPQFFLQSNFPYRCF
jgi:hypothetical protein